MQNTRHLYRIYVRLDSSIEISVGRYKICFSVTLWRFWIHSAVGSTRNTLHNVVVELECAVELNNRYNITSDIYR